MTIIEALTRLEQQLIQLDELEQKAKEHPAILLSIAENRTKILMTLSKIEAQITRATGENIDGSLN